MVENAGSLPARIAHQIGFVDYLPRIDPLDALVKYNKQKKENDSGIVPTSNSSKFVEIKSTNTEMEAKRGDAEKNGTSDVANQEAENPAATVDDGSREKSITETQSAQDESLFEKWKFETDLDHFKADAKISIEAYGRQKAMERQKELKEWRTYQSLREMSESSSLMKGMLALMGYSAPYYNIPKVRRISLWEEPILKGALHLAHHCL
jgi:hypothetical protein